MSSLVEVKVARDQGIFLDPSLRETKAPQPPSHHDDREKKELADGGEVKEKEYIPLHVAREKILVLQDELRNMKRRHIAVIEAMQKEFSDRDGEARESYNAVLNQAKEQAKSRIHVHKMRGEKFRTELQRERTERERQAKDNSERLAENKARIDSLDRIILELKASLEKHRNDLNSAKEESETLNKQVEDAKREARFVSGDLNSMTEERDRMRKLRDEHESEIERLNDRHREHESKTRELEARLDVMMREKGDASKEEVELLRKQLTDTTTQLEETRKRARLPTSTSHTGSSSGSEDAEELRARLAVAQQDLDEVSQLLDQQGEEEPGNSPRSELAKKLRDALRLARSDLSAVRQQRDHLERSNSMTGSATAVEVKEEVVVAGEDPALTARRRELRDQIARLIAQIDGMRNSLVPRNASLEAKESEYSPMAAEVKRLFDIAKPLDEERARLLATYRLLQDSEGKQVPFGPTEIKALERLNQLNEQIPAIRAIIEPIFRDLKEKDKNEKERERIKASFAALKDEIKAKKEAGDEEGAAAVKEKALAEKKEYESLGAWLANYPARREEFDSKKAEMNALEAERQGLCLGALRFQWMRNGSEEKVVLKPPAPDDLKRLGEIYGHRARFTDAKAAMDPLKKQLEVLRTEVANERSALANCEEELKKLKAEFDALPPPPAGSAAAKSVKSSAPAAPSKPASLTNNRSGGGGGVDPAVVSRMEREAAADKKSALDKQRASYDEQIAELTERIRKLEKIIDDMREGDTDSRLRVLDQQLKDERAGYEKKIAALQSASASSDHEMSEMKKRMDSEVERLTKALHKAEDDLKKRPAAASGSTPSTPNPNAVTGAKFGADPAVLAAAEEKAAGLNAEIAKLRAELDDSHSAKRKADDHAAELKARIDAFGAKEAPLMTNSAIKELQQQIGHTKDTLDAEIKKAHSLEGQLQVKTDELSSAHNEIAQLKSQTESMTTSHATEVAELRAQADRLSSDSKQQLADMEANLTAASDKRASELKAAHDSRVAELDAEIADLKSKLTTSEARANDLDGKLTAETSLRESTQKSLSDLDTEHKALVSVHAVCDGKITELTKETTERKATMEAQASEIKTLTDQVAFMKLRVSEEQERRKKLQFELEDAKGKIRVYARVRPFSSKELENKEEDAVRLGANNWSLELHWPEYGADGSLRKDTWLPFTFDAVFHPKLGGATQDQVFEECRAFVELAQNGVNTCIFCYGQSGTGKTFTMSGKSSDPVLRGLKPRAIHYIFETAKKNAATHEYSVKAYAVEVYNDTLVDVFWKHSRYKATNSEKPSKWGPPPQLELKNEMDPKTKAVKRVRIDGVIEHEFKDPDEMVAFLDEAEVRRATRATALNPESSRSHMIFAITITTKVISGKDKGKTYTGKISLCDLAGSERPSKAEVAGLPPNEAAALTEEGKHINMSLSNLRLVFEKLGSQDKKTVIDYTQSTLTKVMRDSLGGNAKALMFVNLGPAQSNQNESKDSLGFGKLVSNIVTQQKASVDSDNSEMIKNLQFKLEQYEKKFGSL